MGRIGGSDERYILGSSITKITGSEETGLPPYIHELLNLPQKTAALGLEGTQKGY